MKYFDDGTDRKCIVCKKKFSTFYFPRWAYKTIIKGKPKYFCGYNCMRAWQRAQEEKKKKPGQGVELVKLRELIKSKGMNIRKFAYEVGLTEGMVSYILAGKRPLKEWNKENFARALKMSVEELNEYTEGQ